MAKKYLDDKPIAWTAELGLTVKNQNLRMKNNMTS